MQIVKNNNEERLRKFLKLSVAPVLGLTAGLLISDAAFAQTQIEQMVVTATKRSQELQQVPASISAFSGEGLENRHIRNVEDITHSTPNLTIALTGGTTPQLSIRGVSPDGTSPLLEGTVAVHVDGIYQPRMFGLNMTLMDLDSLEVLRGPQGTVYGRNANAGVINFNTAKPTDTFQGKATIMGSKRGGARYGANGYVSGPVAEGVSVRLSGMIDRSDGYVKDLGTGDWVNGSNQFGGRLSVRLKPTDDVTWDLSSSVYKDHNSNTVVLASDPLQGPGQNYTILRSRPGGVAATTYTLDPWKTYESFEPDNYINVYTASSVLAWDITPDVTVKSITGWQWATSHSFVDQDGFRAEYLPARPYGDSHTWSQEFNMNAKLFDRLDAVVGLYYLYDMVKGGNLNPIPPGNPVGSAATPGLYLWNVEDQETKSKAAFLDLTFSVTDDLRLLGGVRRTIDERNTVQQIQTYINASAYLDPFTFPGASKLSGCGPNHAVPGQVFNSTTFKAGAQYDFTPDIMGYVQWQDGFKDGGYNVSLCDNTYAPEKIYSWEVGLKSTLFNGTTTLNVTYFHYNYINMQLSRTINLSPTVITSLIDNAATAKVDGGEIELNTNLTDDLSADISVGILNGKYGSLSSRNGAVPGNPLVDLTGFTLPRSPKLTFNAGLDYTLRAGDFADVKLRGEYNFTGKTYFTPFNEPIATQGGYSVWNAFVTVTPDNCNLEFQIFAKNLTDKYYRNSMFTSGIMFMSRSAVTPPREIGGMITAKF